MSLGFPDTVRIELEGNICREEGPLPECFAKPRQIILHTLEQVRVTFVSLFVSIKCYCGIIMDTEHENVPFFYPPHEWFWMQDEKKC